MQTEKRFEAGVVAFIKAQAGFGFIEADEDGTRIHFSKTTCRIPWGEQLLNQRVSFCRAAGDREDFATVVLPIDAH